MIRFKQLFFALLFFTVLPALSAMDAQELVPAQRQVDWQSLPEGIWNIIVKHLPGDNKFLNAWARTHNVPQEIIDKIVAKYLKSHCVPTRFMPQAINSHFLTVHGTDQAKQDFHSKINLAFTQKRDTEDDRRFNNFYKFLTKLTNSFSDADIVANQAMYSNCKHFAIDANLRDDIKRAQAEGRLALMKEAISKDLHFIRLARNLAFECVPKLRACARVSAVAPVTDAQKVDHILKCEQDALTAKPVIGMVAMVAGFDCIVRALAYKKGLVSLKSAICVLPWNFPQYLSGNLKLAARTSSYIAIGVLAGTSLIVANIFAIGGAHLYFRDLKSIQKKIAIFANVESSLVRVQRMISEVEEGRA